MRSLRTLALAMLLGVPLTLGLAVVPSTASPIVTLSEFQTLYPDYINHEFQNGFQIPCVDAAGTLVLNVDVSDILGTVTEPISVVMLCQMIGYPPFTPVGPVTFSDPGIQLLGLSSVPGHPDAFSIEYIVPLGANTFTITIENTGWPMGCLDGLIDFAAWDLASVGAGTSSFGAVKALFQ